jgi:hypothetical protein
MTDAGRTRTMNLSDRVLSRNGDIIYAPVGDEQAVMLSIETGRYYSINAVGRRVWELLERPRALAELRAAISEEFDVDAAACEADIVDFVRELMNNGMVLAAEA